MGLMPLATQKILKKIGYIKENKKHYIFSFLREQSGLICFIFFVMSNCFYINHVIIKVI